MNSLFVNLCIQYQIESIIVPRASRYILIGRYSPAGFRLPLPENDAVVVEAGDGEGHAAAGELVEILSRLTLDLLISNTDSGFE